MSWISIFIFFCFSILINIIISSFLIARSHYSKKILFEVEQSLSNLIKNVNQATYEQITLAEEYIKKLQAENRLGRDIHNKLAFLNDEKYQTLLYVLKAIERKKIRDFFIPSVEKNGDKKERHIVVTKKYNQVVFNKKKQDKEKQKKSKQLQDIDYTTLSRDEIDLLKL